MTKPIKVFYFDLSGTFWASNKYKKEGDTYIITGEKFDVTQDIARVIVEKEITFDSAPLNF